MSLHSFDSQPAPLPPPADAAPSCLGATNMSRGRASWSGMLKLSLVTVPIKAYPAAVTSQQVHFNQLHAGCGQRIRYEKHCPIHGKVEAGAIVSGYAYAPDQYVLVDQAELEPLRPVQDRALSLERFLDPHELDPALFSGRTLYLVPDGLAAQHAYAVLTGALNERHKWAVGRVVLGGHRVVAVVRPMGQVLAMHVLHFPDQVRSAQAVAPTPQVEAPSAEEQKLASILINAATKPVPWADYRDDTAEHIKALVEAKLQGRTLTPPPAEETPILYLLDALKRSVAQTLQWKRRPDQAAAATAEASAGAPKSRKKSPRQSA